MPARDAVHDLARESAPAAAPVRVVPTPTLDRKEQNVGDDLAVVLDDADCILGKASEGEDGTLPPAPAPATAPAPPPAPPAAHDQSREAELEDVQQHRELVADDGDDGATLVAHDRLGRRVVLRRRKDEEREELERHRARRQPAWKSNFADSPPPAEMNLESYVAHERRQTEQLEARGFVQPPPTGFVHERSSLAKLSCACGKRAISGDTAASKSATAAEASNKELAAAGDAPDGGAACTATATATAPSNRAGAGRKAANEIDKLVQDTRERKWIQRLEARGTLQPFMPAASPSLSGSERSSRHDRSNRDLRGGSNWEASAGNPASTSPLPSSRAVLPKLKALLPKASRGVARRSGSAPPERPLSARTSTSVATTTSSKGQAASKKSPHGAQLTMEELFKLRYPAAAEIAFPPPAPPKGDPVRAEEAAARGLVVTKAKLKVRTGHMLDTEDVGDLLAGSTVRVLDECDLPDGTHRAHVSVDGEKVARGWVSAISKDGSENLLQPEDALAMQLVAQLEEAANQVEVVKSSRLADADTPYIRRHGDPAGLIRRSVEEARQGMRNAAQHSAVELSGTVLAGSASIERGRGY